MVPTPCAYRCCRTSCGSSGVSTKPGGKGLIARPAENRAQRKEAFCPAKWSILKTMAAGHVLNNEAEALRIEIRNALPYGQDWFTTPHQLLGGDTPEARILAGDLEAVTNLFHSILYVGVA